MTIDTTLAFDSDSAITPRVISQMKAAGVRAVCLYSRNLTGPVVALLGAALIRIVVIWENGQGAQPGYYTEANGAAAARAMLRQLALAGLTGPGVLYACGADFDANQAQVSHGTVPFFTGFGGVIKPLGHKAGSYGNGLVNQTLKDKSLVDYHWVWGVKSSYGTAAFLASNAWHLHQHVTSSRFGILVDDDDINPAFADDYGGWLPAAAPGASAPGAAAPG